MGFWLYMLLIAALIPVIMIFTGRHFQRKPPAKINYVYGYRTTRSTKSPEAWEFANRHMGRLWFRMGLVLLPVSLIPMFFVLGREPDTVGSVATAVCLLQLIPLVGSIFPVESALKRNFDENGVKK